MAILAGARQDQTEVFDTLKSTMDFRHQVQSYHEVITQCEKRQPLEFSMPRVSIDQPYALAPWCYIEADRIYHDFHGVYAQEEDLIRLLQETPMVSQADAAQKQVSSALWEKWLAHTYLVPVQSDQK
jgi:hypothetical protein